MRFLSLLTFALLAGVLPAAPEAALSQSKMKEQVSAPQSGSPPIPIKLWGPKREPRTENVSGSKQRLV